ncbi:unnamed protein product [Gordionus sp. m RMFG-2023]
MPGFLSISFTQIKSYQKKSEKQNLLAEEEILINESNGELIDWKHIQNLHKLQECEGLRAANKLRKAHIAFHKQKMKVKLAVQHPGNGEGIINWGNPKNEVLFNI